MKGAKILGRKWANSKTVLIRATLNTPPYLQGKFLFVVLMVTPASSKLRICFRQGLNCRSVAYRATNYPAWIRGSCVPMWLRYQIVLPISVCTVLSVVQYTWYSAVRLALLNMSTIQFKRASDRPKPYLSIWDNRSILSCSFWLLLQVSAGYTCWRRHSSQIQPPKGKFRSELLLGSAWTMLGGFFEKIWRKLCKIMNWNNIYHD